MPRRTPRRSWTTIYNDDIDNDMISILSNNDDIDNDIAPDPKP